MGSPVQTTTTTTPPPYTTTTTPPPSTYTTPPPTTTTTPPAITATNLTTSTTMLLLLVVVVAPLAMANPTGSYGDLETWRDSPLLSGDSEDYCRYACDGKGGCITTYTGAPSSPWQAEMGTSSSPSSSSSSSSSSSTSTSPPPPGHLHGWGGVGGVCEVWRV